MKLLNFRADAFGIGTNPEGGVCVTVVLETEQEKTLFGFKNNPNKITFDVPKRSVYHEGGVPLDNGLNPTWSALAEYLGQDPIQWAKEIQRTWRRYS